MYVRFSTTKSVTDRHPYIQTDILVHPYIHTYKQMQGGAPLLKKTQWIEKCFLISFLIINNMFNGKVCLESITRGEENDI